MSLQPDPGFKDWQRRERLAGRSSILHSISVERNVRSETTADQLERFLPDVTLIGPTAGAELRRLVYGGDE